MQVRECCAPQFYAGDCARSIERFLRGFSVPDTPERVVGAIVPHAGWLYSGAVAAKVFESIRRKTNPATFVIFGAVHRWATINGIYARGGWETPFGILEIDEPLAAAMLHEAREWITDDARAHHREHAIEVELPFIKRLFPEARFVPIAVNPDDRAVPLGRRIGEILKKWDRPAVVIGSSDLTHYGDPYSFVPAGYGPKAHDWLQQNDLRMIGLAKDMKAPQILDEARQSHNACGPGAIAATVEAAKALGAAGGHVVDYTTSYDVVPEGEFEMAVGYAGLLY